MTTLPLISHWYNGAEQASTSPDVLPVYDPAKGVQTKNVASAQKQDIENVIASAKAAFPAWASDGADVVFPDCNCCR